MIKLIKKADYKKTLWKNGQGSTEEIYIFPETARFSNDPFDFRLSSATLQNVSEFSIFTGYQRWLTVIDGLGLTLNGLELRLLEDIHHFSGSEKILCRPLTVPTVDLGLIYNKEVVKAQMELIRFGELRLDLKSQTHYFIVCAEGFYTAKTPQGVLTIRRFDTLHITDETAIDLQSSDVIAVLITVSFC